MSRQEIIRMTGCEKSVTDLYKVLATRGVVAPVSNCPVEQSSAFVKLCLSQSCGKCVPCRVGLKQIASIIDRILDGKGKAEDLDTLKSLANTIKDSADCAIGFGAAEALLRNIENFRKDFESHITHDRCTASFIPVPCKASCPAHVDIPRYVALVKEGRYADAVRTIRFDNPFPAACALICEHPCEAACRRNMIDASVNIRGIKRMAVEMAGKVDAPACMPSTGKRIAVVGGGPSGLTAAYYLQLMGHKVTVFEQRKQLGGMMRYGIPRYRLPESFLDEDINNVLSTGVEVKLEAKITGDCYEDMKKEYDCIYLAIGAHNAKTLGIEGEDAENVISAVELLCAIGDNEKPDFKGKRVVIVGGGNVAMDCTRTAQRLGASSVQCIYRRRREDMTALPEEIEGAIAETCEIVSLMAPVRVEKDAEGKVAALIVAPQIPGSYEGGRPKPVRADAPEMRIECDIIIAAIGQAIDSAEFAAKGLPVKRESLAAGKGCFIAEGVFAGGDCASGPSTVIRAVEAGKTAAANIDEYLGYKHVLPRDIEIPYAPAAPMEASGRINFKERAAFDRKYDFDIMEQNMTKQECEQECSRCLRCDCRGFGAFRGGKGQTW